VAYSRTGDYDQALADLGEAIRLNPGYARAYLARAWVHAKKGDDAQAKADRQKAGELDPSLEKSDGGNP
jgi:tetratricopeptide (TPR) repeat protein